MTFGKFMAAVIYTKAENEKVSPSGRVATLVSGIGSRVLGTLNILAPMQAKFHRQFAENCVHFSELSWWLDTDHLLILR
jgi:hypothetical protein